MNRRTGIACASRRRLVAALALATAPFAIRAADALPAKRLAIFSRHDEAYARGQFADSSLKALAARGYVEGRNLEVILCFDDGKRGLDDRIAAIVAWKPEAILTMGTPATAGLLSATRTIPIVTTAADPVGAGFASTMARPGGNVTGFALSGPEMAIKTMEVLRMPMPRLSRVAIIFIDNAAGRLMASYPEQAARAAGLVPVQFPFKENKDLPRLFRSIAASGCLAAFWGFAPGIEELDAVREAIRTRIALVSPLERMTEYGALASFSDAGQNFGERSAEMLVKIFRGASPAVIPFEYPDRFRFAINAATAAKLGVKLTADIRLRADRVIE